MPVNGATYGNRKSTQTLTELNKFGGSGRGSMQAYLYPLAHASSVYFMDDFLYDTLETSMTAVTNSANATPFAITVAQSGTIQGSTGATDNEAIDIRWPANWYGDKNCGMEVRWKSDVVTGLHFEIGFIDAATNAALGACSDVDTPTVDNGAADVAIVAMDTDQTLKTMCFVTDGSTSNYNGTKTNLSTLAPTAATWQTVRIQLEGDKSYCQIDNNDSYVARHGGATASKIEGGTALIPRLFFQTRDTNAKTIDIDYVRFWQDR